MSESLEVLGMKVRTLRARVDTMVARAVIKRVNAALKTVRLQITIMADETEDNVELLQGYGVSFTPPAGSEALALAVSGARSHTVCIMAQNPNERPTDAPERAGGLYNKGEWRFYVNAEGTTCTGAKDSDQHHPLGDLLVAAIKALTVPTAMGPSGTPINAAQFDHVLSKHKVAP